MSLRLIVIALLLTTAAALGLIAYRAAQAPAPVSLASLPSAPLPPPLATTAYLTAARILPAGTLAKDDDFAVKTAPAGELPPNAFEAGPDTLSSIRGALIRHFLEAGAIVTTADILRPRERGYLAAVLAPGTRAVSIGVDAITGVAGLIWPGDQVDVILTQEIDQADAPLARRVLSETILTNIRVIAVDQEIVQGATAASGAPQQGASSISPGRNARTVTLQVDADAAEKLSIAQRLGHLALAIRSASEAPPTSALAAAIGTIYASDVSPALSAAGERPGARVQVIQGDKVSDVIFHQ